MRLSEKKQLIDYIQSMPDSSEKESCLGILEKSLDVADIEGAYVSQHDVQQVIGKGKDFTVPRELLEEIAKDIERYSSIFDDIPIQINEIISSEKYSTINKVK